MFTFASRESKFTTEQTSAFITILHVLLDNLKSEAKIWSLHDSNIIFFSVLLFRKTYALRRKHEGASGYAMWGGMSWSAVFIGVLHLKGVCCYTCLHQISTVPALCSLWVPLYRRPGGGSHQCKSEEGKGMKDLAYSDISAFEGQFVKLSQKWKKNSLNLFILRSLWMA